MSARTEYRIGDSQTILVAKILRRLSGSPTPADTEVTLWRKILVALGGSPSPSDGLYDLLLKIERILDPDNLCNCADSEFSLLQKILELLAPGSFRPGDNGYILRRKILGVITIVPIVPGGECCLLLETDGELLLESTDGCLLLETCA